NYVFNIDDAAVAPDGSRIVIDYQHDLQAALTDGTLVNLTSNNSQTVSAPDYAPNGSKIIYHQGNYLAVMNADGSNAVSLDVVGDNPDWNPTAILAEPTPTPTPTPTPAILADLAVKASSSPQIVTVGGQTIYTIGVSNNGSSAATGVQITGQLPQALTVTNFQPTQGSCSVINAQLNCQLGSVAVNASATITLTGTVDVIGYADAQFTAAAIENDPDTSNNSASAGVTATGPCSAPVTTPIEITREQWRRDERSAQDELILTIRNRADHNLDPRLIFVFDGLPQSVSIDPSVVAGYTQCAPPLGSPYVVSFAPNKKEWKPMQTVSVRVLFNNPSRGGIPFTWRLYSGDVNP
ncbi:MAG TPA: DUF11 domain-containing protein, partial [Pyrinomonadaceae bacterium]|nr:DUF11 domain-containing protein [Pyrinomonadaceae bacterium]